MPTAQDILAKKTGEVAMIDQDATVMEAAKIMSDRRIGSLVVGRRDKIVGIFTERDVLNRVVARHLDTMKTIVKDVMTTPVACCQPTTKLLPILELSIITCSLRSVQHSSFTIKRWFCSGTSN